MNLLESDWIQEARQGNDEAFTHLVEAYQKPVYNLCYRMLGNDQEAEDAAQETFWRAYRALDRYDPQRSFATWLLAIAAHYCIDQLRRHRPHSFSIDVMDDEVLPDKSIDIEMVGSRMEEQRLVRELVAEMNPIDRAVLILRYWYDLSDREISETISISISAVKSRLHRARRDLASKWQARTREQTSPERNNNESPAF